MCKSRRMECVTHEAPCLTCLVVLAVYCHARLAIGCTLWRVLCWLSLLVSDSCNQSSLLGCCPVPTLRFVRSSPLCSALTAAMISVRRWQSPAIVQEHARGDSLLLVLAFLVLGGAQSCRKLFHDNTLFCIISRRLLL